MSNFKEIYNRILNSKKILILTHQKPDPDAIGSMLAFKLIIALMNKEIKVEPVVTEIPDFIDVLPNHQDLLTEVTNDYDLILLVDTSSKVQLGKFGDFLEFKEKLIIIDHHLVEIDKEIMHYVDKSAASTTMVIYQFMKDNEIELKKDIATCLYVGLLGDTGGFSLRGTTSEALSVASELLKAGIDHQSLYKDLIKPGYTLNYLQLKRIAIQNLEIIDEKIAFTSLDYNTLRKYNMIDMKPQPFVLIGRHIKGIEVSVLIVEEEPNNYRVSLRSNEYLNVSEVAKTFGGAGHKFASGFRFSSDVSPVKEELIKELKKRLKDTYD